MKNRAATLTLVACVSMVGIALAEGRRPASHDLDSYSDTQLRRDLMDELDDITLQSDGQYPLSELREAILDALDDDDDEGDENEIDLQDLNDEMEEDSTTLGDVVDDALARADELALGVPAQRPSWTFVTAGGEGPVWGPALFLPAAQSRNVRRGFTTTRVAIAQTTDQLIVAIRKK